MQKESIFWRSFFDHMSAVYLTGGYEHCGEYWYDYNYVPDYSKFYYILDGECKITIDGREYFPKPGQLVMMPEGVCQSYCHINENHLTKHWCHFTAESLGKKLFDTVKASYIIDVECPERLESLFRTMNSGQEGYLEILQKKAALLEVLYDFLSSACCIGESFDGLVIDSRLRDVTAFIDCHIGQDISIEELAKIAHLHPNYLIRLFKSQLGMSPVQYINLKRIEIAQQLLKNPKISVAEAAERLGIGDVFYFSKLFKKYVGISPSRFKEKEEKQ